MRLWDVGAGKPVRKLIGHSKAVTSVAFTPDGKYAVSASWDKTVKVWDIAKGRLRGIISGHADKVHPVAISPNGRFIASGGLGRDSGCGNSSLESRYCG